tara:strand:+ start:10691 stop:11491 length:801 start_codon:yes stop_codon:yes gene_type:complete
MSGAAAVASARRRRANGAPEPSPPQRQVNNNQRQPEPDSNNQMTPLQILQLHDDKLTSLEEDFDSRVEKIILEKMNKSNASNTTDSNILDSNITEEINNKIENVVSVKLTNVNDTIKSILLNIEKLSEFTNINDKNTSKIDGLINEINALKMLVIKTQTLSLETNNDIIKMKDSIKDLEEYKNSPTNLNGMDNGLNFMKTMMGMSDLDIEKQENSSLNILGNVEDLNGINDINDINDIKDCILQEFSNQSNENNENNSDVVEISEN